MVIAYFRTVSYFCSLMELVLQMSRNWKRLASLQWKQLLLHQKRLFWLLKAYQRQKQTKLWLSVNI
jgi:hypothetical protein